FFSSRRRHTRSKRDWSSDVCSSDLSDGEIGYVHVRGMNENSYRHVFGKVLGENIGKEALAVDTRFNGGGWLHDKLASFLNGELYMKFAPQGEVVAGGESLDKWTKPSAVIMSESNYRSEERRVGKESERRR